MYRLVFIICFLGGAIVTRSQELNCTITLNTSQLYSQQTTNAEAMAQLKATITDFMNSKRWTADNFTADEKIICKVNINLLRSPSQGNYEGNAQVIVTRPVYGSNYETVILNFIDRNFNFSYLPGNPMYFNENSYSDELTQTLAFYAYIILATDYDSFSKQGGEPFVQKAFQLANIAKNYGGAGWGSSSSETRTRYWLVENMMNGQLIPFREVIYNYHRLGLDTFVANPVMARKQISEALNTIRKVNELKPSTLIINSFFDAKGEEIYKILKEAPREERQRAYQTLSLIDPGKTETYRKLLQ
jgi:Domain of unknown function (DUF4835)